MHPIVPTYKEEKYSFKKNIEWIDEQVKKNEIQGYARKVV